MTQAIVDPEAVRSFASRLSAFNRGLDSITSAMESQFGDLGDTWRDQEHASFEQLFNETVRMIKGFIPASDEHVRFLLRKAEAAQEYLNRR